MLPDLPKEETVLQEEFLSNVTPLERFLQGYLDGNLRRDLKPEPIPDSNIDPMKVVVGRAMVPREAPVDPYTLWLYPPHDKRGLGRCG